MPPLSSANGMTYYTSPSTWLPHHPPNPHYNQANHSHLNNQALHTASHPHIHNQALHAASHDILTNLFSANGWGAQQGITPVMNGKKKEKKVKAKGKGEGHGKARRVFEEGLRRRGEEYDLGDLVTDLVVGFGLEGIMSMDRNEGEGKRDRELKVGKKEVKKDEEGAEEEGEVLEFIKDEELLEIGQEI